MTQKTAYFTKNEIDRDWYLIDAKDKVLGRLATKIARLLLGKESPKFTPGQDTGSFVVVINASRIRVTGAKAKNKVYYRHSGYPGGLKAETFEVLIKRKPTEVLLKAVAGMLPHNRLGKRLITKLKIYAGESHPHQAQKPVTIEQSQGG